MAKKPTPKKPAAKNRPKLPPAQAKINLGASSMAFMERYLNNASPTGFETSGQKLWLDYIRPWVDSTFTDPYGTAIGVINPAAAYKVVIEAHADEISWFVHYITGDGFIYVRRNGGSDHMIAPSKRVNIHTDKGMVKGIFGWPAIHVRNGKNDPVPSLDNIFLDCGCANKEEVEKLGVHVGCVVTYEDEFMVLNGKTLVGRALDNRMGGFMIAEVARLLKEQKVKLPFGLYITNSVQEEVGLRGAEMIVERIRPDLALVTDVTHDTQSPMMNKIQSGDVACGKGPVLSYGPAVHNNVLRKVIAAAEREKIPFQRAAVSRATGTDTDAFAYGAAGVPSALISLPLRYMHTTVESVNKQDVEHVIQLILATICSLKAGEDLRYIK
ncbi:MAG: M20/M25/M40 family metallo-hydrolase [Bacteroidetes bacterium]|nr:M20/M25/M40 family metallo-hydrolase [Bacteroidota bacterium]